MIKLLQKGISFHISNKMHVPRLVFTCSKIPLNMPLQAYDFYVNFPMTCGKKILVQSIWFEIKMATNICNLSKKHSKIEKKTFLTFVLHMR